MIQRILRKKKDKIVSFADDTNLLLGQKKISSLIHNFRGHSFISTFHTWFQKNKSALNMEKTNVIIFFTKQGTLNRPNKIHFLTDEN